MPMFCFRVRVSEVRWVEDTFVVQAEDLRRARSRLDKAVALANEKQGPIKNSHVRPKRQDWGEQFSLPNPSARADATCERTISVKDLPSE